MSWEQTEYELKYPIEIDGDTLKTIILKMPNGAGLLEIEDMKLESKAGDDDLTLRAIMKLISVFGYEVPADFVKKMHPFDIKGAGAKIAPLLELLFKMGEGQEADKPSPDQS